MRLTAVVNSMHIGNTFKNIWNVQHKRKVIDFTPKVKGRIEAKGRKVVNAVEFLNLRPLAPPVNIQEKEVAAIDPSVIPKLYSWDQSHPDWHDEPCLTFSDHSSLLTGFDEALHITKTCLVTNSLPDRICSLRTNASEEVHSRTQQAILNAHVLDALQIKLPIAINYDQPGRRAPRSYGLPKWRRNVQLLAKMFHVADLSLTKENLDITRNQLTSEIVIKAPLTMDGRPFQIELEKNLLVFGRKPLQPFIVGENKDKLLSKELPSIYPVSRSLSLRSQNIYRLETKFPVKKGAPLGHLAMVISRNNRPYPKNDKSQLQGRFLLHTFGVAAAYAQDRYGKDVKDLPEPLTVNCLHTDSQEFFFGCLQLHSLDLDSSRAANNLFWMEEPKRLFLKCDYVDCRPVLEGYNPEVMETLMALYRSQLLA